MKSLWSPSDREAILERLGALTPTTPRQWGSMDVEQMLDHVHRALQPATGELRLKRSVIGFLFGRIAKRKLMSDKPWDRNLPTDKHFVVREPRDFEGVRDALLAALGRFADLGPDGVAQEPHPFFGRLTPDEWGLLTWKHLDHHLRQFGV